MYGKQFAIIGVIAAYAAQTAVARRLIAKRKQNEQQLRDARLATGLTTDPTDPSLGHGSDTEPGPQNEMYLVLSPSELAKGFVRPVRRKYQHKKCGAVTVMSQQIAETYARDPKFYGATYCVQCQMHRPVSEFVWDGTSEDVGS